MKTTVLQECVLFKGIDEEEIEKVVQCLKGFTKTYQKEECILQMGEYANYICIVMSGSVEIVMNDVWGRQNIVAHIQVSDCFGEAYACAKEEVLLVSANAKEKTTVLFIDSNNILGTCSSLCQYHVQIMRNLIGVLAQKNLLLTRKVEHISQKTIKDRLLAYLSYQSIKQNNKEITLPFDRQQLADYLHVDRSAMSNALSKMQKEGLIQFRKNKITVLCEGDHCLYHIER